MEEIDYSDSSSSSDGDDGPSQVQVPSIYSQNAGQPTYSQTNPVTQPSYNNNAHSPSPHSQHSHKSHRSQHSRAQSRHHSHSSSPHLSQHSHRSHSQNSLPKYPIYHSHSSSQQESKHSLHSHHSHSHHSQSNKHGDHSHSPSPQQSQQSHHSHHSHHSAKRLSPSPQIQATDYNKYKYEFPDDDDHDNKINDKARSSVYHDSQSHDLSSVSTDTQALYLRDQKQQQQPLLMSLHESSISHMNDDGQYSMVEYPARQQYHIPQRPDHLYECPPSHCTKIHLMVNAIQATPQIRGKLYRYNVRFHQHSDDPNDADIPENNKARRSDIIRHELYHKIRNKYGKFDFDNTIIYCDRKIVETNRFSYCTREEDDDDEKSNAQHAVLRIQYNKEIDFNSMKVVKEELSHEYISQIAHILHRNIMRKIGYVQFGRSHYIDTDPDAIHKLNIREYPYIEAMRGFISTLEYTQDFQTVVFFRHKLRLKENRTIHHIMQHHYDHAQAHKYESEKDKDSMYKDNVLKEIKGRYFITLYARRSIRRIHGVNFSKSLDTSFYCKGQQMTFREYFWKTYKEELQQDFTGLIEVKNRRGRIDYFPPELCFLTGYPDKLRRDKKITGIIARNSAIPIRDRIAGFEKVIQNCTKYNQMASRQQMISDKNTEGHIRTLEYSDRLLQVNAIRIKPVTILMNSNHGIRSIPDDQLLRCLKDVLPMGNLGGGNNGRTHLCKWGIAYFTHAPQQPGGREQSDLYCYQMLDTFFKRQIETFFANGNDNNLALERYPNVIEIRTRSPHDDMQWYLNKMIHVLDDNISQAQLEGLVVILPSICASDAMQSEIYNTIKALCNVKTGTITQCIRASSIAPAHQNGNGGRRRNRSGQILLSTFRQFVVKLGVIPWKVLFENINEPNQNDPRFNYLPDGAIDLKKPTMIIGIDVNHNRFRGVSTIGFIATYDRDLVRPMAQVSYQKMGQEVLGIQQLQLLTENALRNFKEMNAVSPQQIFVYRDGVSLGELNQVTEKELVAIRQAAVNVADDCQHPLVEFMVVQKRVNARFYEWDQKQGDLLGPKPRVIIESGIVSAQFWDFYLIACGAPKDKVANPVRVIIVNDDLQLAQKKSKNDIELFTYALCNAYFGWGGAIKIPHVIKYADKIAEQYSGMYDYMELVEKQREDNKPNTDSGLNLSPHFI